MTYSAQGESRPNAASPAVIAFDLVFPAAVRPVPAMVIAREVER